MSPLSESERAEADRLFGAAVSAARRAAARLPAPPTPDELRNVATDVLLRFVRRPPAAADPTVRVRHLRAYVALAVRRYAAARAARLARERTPGLAADFGPESVSGHPSGLGDRLRVARLLRRLGGTERAVLSLSLGLSGQAALPDPEIAERVGVSSEAVPAIRLRAIAKLRGDPPPAPEAPSSPGPAGP